MNKRKFISLLGMLIIAILLGYIAFYITAQKNRSAIYNELSEDVVSEVASTEETSETVETKLENQVITDEENLLLGEQEELEVEVQGELNIDFEELKALNEDIYAWIDIPGTEVSYPILQHPSDDTYYLDYTVEHVKGLPGSIYTEGKYASKDFSDFNVVIYGHDMNNGTMFGTLELYRDEVYRNEHNEIYIYTQEETFVYDIYATVVYDDRHISWTYKQEDTYEQYIKSLSNSNDISNYVNADLNPTSESNMITLSTCIGNMPNNRYLVVAVKR